jgi:5-methylcytosine-specific restriction protein A
MEFVRLVQYTRKDVWKAYHTNQGEMPKGGIWQNGYVTEGDELIAFININSPGRTGHDYQNSFDEENELLTWFGQTRAHSKQPTFKKLLNKELFPHFFARWDSSDHQFTYLGSGDILSYKDKHSIEPVETIKLLIQITNTPRSIGNPKTDNPELIKLPTFAKKVQSIVNRYERDPYKRMLCLKHFGYKCQICNFSFQEEYGDIGKSFCHVHHIEPLNEVGGEKDIDPIKDLIPVCPNCHSMLHIKKPALKPEELKMILEKNHRHGL